MAPIKTTSYARLISNIGKAIEEARTNALRIINAELVRANWEIGRHLVEFEQQGNRRAAYGSDLVARISADLKIKYGNGFGRRNLLDMRRFYLAYPQWKLVSTSLNWSHYIALISITDNNARGFYEKQTRLENWSSRELERQISASLFERLALSRDKKGILSLAKSGHEASSNKALVKDPYVLDFLQIPHNKRVTEKVLEQKIIDNLQLFLLELGKGFAFVGRQYKVSLRNKHFYVDLVFYHRILKCFVLIDIKTKSVQHSDIGQMNLYLNYFKAEENMDNDNEPIGIILSAEKDEVLVEYATGGISNKIFVSKYQLYLPDKKDLKKQVAEAIHPKPRKRSPK